MRGCLWLTKTVIFVKLNPVTKLEQALTAFPTLAPEQQDTIADFIINAALPVIDFSDEELATIDARTAAADAGDFASDKDVHEVFARFR